MFFSTPSTVLRWFSAGCVLQAMFEADGPVPLPFHPRE